MTEARTINGTFQVKTHLHQPQQHDYHLQQQPTQHSQALATVIVDLYSALSRAAHL